MGVSINGGTPIAEGLSQNIPYIKWKIKHAWNHQPAITSTQVLKYPSKIDLVYVYMDTA